MDLGVPSLTCVAGSKVDDDEHDKGGGGGNDDISLGLGFLGGGRLGFRLVWTAYEDEMFACGCAAHIKNTVHRHLGACGPPNLMRKVRLQN